MSLTVLLKYFLFGWLLPYVLGLRLSRKAQLEGARPLLSVLYGYFILWTVIQGISIPMIFLRRSFREMLVFCLVILVAVAGLNLITEYKDSFKTWMAYPQLWKKQGILQSIWILLVVAQAIYIALCYLVNDDDAYYVATAQTSLDTDSMYVMDPYTGKELKSFPARYVMSPFPLFVAFMSRIIGVKAPAFAHTLLPFLLVLFALYICYLWAHQLFPKARAAQTVFLYLSMTILAYSNFTTHARGMMLYSRIWQGKAVLAAILLPFLFLLGVRMVTQTYRKADWGLLFLVMMSSCLVSSMGIMLAAIEIGIFGILAGIHHKRWKEIGATMLCCLPNLLYAGIYVFIR